ncbi:MAG: EamA family transporter [Microgenomates group bacterium]|jgi:drug/metabolite transporter (DMT)-like permease
MNIFNTWQLNLILYLISIVLFFQFYKLAVKNAKRDGAAAVTLQLLAGTSVLFLAPFFAIKFPTEIKWYLLLAGACVFYALNDRLQATARKHLQVSVFTVINQLNTVFLIIYGIAIFKDPFSFTKLLGAAVIIGANVLLRYSNGKIEINKYVGMAVLAAVALATAISVDIGISGLFNLPIYIMLTFFIPALFIVFGERIKISDVATEFNGQDRKYYILTGVFWALTIFFSLRSFQLGSVTTVVPLQATNVLLNVIVAYLFLGERKDGLKKVIAALMVILGIYLTILN